MADILIETEHAVWTLMVRRDDWLEGTEAGSDPVARLIDAGSWLAGTRNYHFGLIVFDPERTPVANGAGPALRPIGKQLVAAVGFEVWPEGERARRWADVLGRSGGHPARLRRVASAVRHRTSTRSERACLARRGRHCPDGSALDLASMPRDSCEVGVITRVPPIDGQPTCELVNLFHSVLVTRGYDARLAWYHADRVDVSTRCGSGHKHVA